jgi:hypothetical protein
MSDVALFCYSCRAMGNLIKCCPDAPGSVALVPVGLANAVARLLGNLESERDALAAQIQGMREQEPVAIAEPMPGTTAFTMAVFKTRDVPPGTGLYAAPVPAQEDARGDLVAALYSLLEEEPLECNFDGRGYCTSHHGDHQLDGCRVAKARAILAAKGGQRG